MSLLRSAFAKHVLAWFDQHGRHDLPWQQDRTPYRVWLSEIMLQQTQVTTVIPYFQKFVAKFPTIQSLADAGQDEIMSVWAGLGYYSRARNLHKAAQVVRDEYAGQFPTDFEQVVALPGIGRSTAGAILSLACDQRWPILDGNVKRVLTRYFTVDGWPGKTAVANQLWQIADQLTPKLRVADYTQAIMDLGATVCTRTRPKCNNCPLRTDCQALLTNNIERYPAKKPKTEKPTRSTVVLIVIDEQQRVYLVKRPNYGIWGGLWCLPQIESRDSLSGWLLQKLSVDKFESQALDPFRHTFTHYHLDIKPILISIDQRQAERLVLNSADQTLWYDTRSDRSIGVPAAVEKILKKVSTNARKAA